MVIEKIAKVALIDFVKVTLGCLCMTLIENLRILVTP